MFSIAYVLLPFGGAAPGEAIRASLARFQRGGLGDVPEDWLAFGDETDVLRQAHEARMTFTELDAGSLRRSAPPQPVCSRNLVRPDDV